MAGEQRPEIPAFPTYVHFTAAACVPAMARRAATQAGFRHTSEWYRDRLARMLAYELDEDYEKIMAQMPAPWDKNPGAARPNKAGVPEGQGG